MASSSTKLTDAKVRLVSAALWVQVVFIPLLATLLQLIPRPSLPSVWLLRGRFILGALALWGIVAPFWFARISRERAIEMRARGADPDGTSALVGMAGFAAPIVCAGALVIAGDEATVAYVAAPISLVGLAYWSCRYRHVLWRSRVDSNSARKERR